MYGPGLMKGGPLYFLNTDRMLLFAEYFDAPLKRRAPPNHAGREGELILVGPMASWIPP